MDPPTGRGWEAASSTGTTSHLPHDDLLTLSRAYGAQAIYRRERELLFEAPTGRTLDRASPSLLADPTGMALILNTLRQWEAGLLREYERALASLGVPADSLAREG